MLIGTELTHFWGGGHCSSTLWPFYTSIHFVLAFYILPPDLTLGNWTAGSKSHIYLSTGNRTLWLGRSNQLLSLAIRPIVHTRSIGQHVS